MYVWKRKIKKTLAAHLVRFLYVRFFRKFRDHFGKNVFNRIPLLYAKGYTCSQYFKDIGVRTISVYCEPGDYLRAAQICFDLSLSFDIDVKFWLSNRKFNAVFPNQNLTETPVFHSKSIDELTENDDVMILCRKRFNGTLAKIYAKTGKIHHIADIWPDMWWRAMMAESFRELRELFPFLPIVIFLEPRYPANKKEYSETEKYAAKNMIGHYCQSILPELQQPNAAIPKTYEGFGYNAEEIIEMLNAPSSYIDDKKIKLTDFSGKRVNIINGHRIVPDQPLNYKRTIYFFGGCITFGAGCPDGGTSSAHLQKLLNESRGDEFRVENCGAFIFGRGKHVFENMKSMPFRPGDILISSFASLSVINGITHTPSGVFHLDTGRMFERPHAWGDNVFFDQGHPNEYGQFAIASKVFDFIKAHNFFDEFINKPAVSQVQSMLTEEEFVQLHSYLKEIAPLCPKIGSIVMNCNPFTYGHRYLIEYAATKCSRLFIFVVEEDKSDFPFVDRIELVKLGTKDISNVTVVPSGKFIISSLTFIDYFGKSEMQDRTIDPSMDVELFGKYIAPKLGINMRFVGEEPLDNVTRQYNEAMCMTLPQYGIELEIIARKKIDGQIISASRVRKLLKAKDFDAIAKIVPETTLEYLKRRYGFE